LLINALKSKLRHSYPFQNASMTNKQRSSNFGGVAAHCSISTHYNSKTAGLIFTIFLHNVKQLAEWERWWFIPFRNARAKS